MNNEIEKARDSLAMIERERQRINFTEFHLARTEGFNQRIRTLERELTHAREINAGSEANVAFLRGELERERAKVRTLRSAMTRLIDVGEEFYDMDCGPTGAPTIEAARAALAATEDAKP